MSQILIAHSPEEEERAALVAEKLGALGYEVSQDNDFDRALSPLERRKLAQSVSEAACVVLLWSREAAEAPAIAAAAQQAKALGKLACARLDASAPPNRVGVKSVANLANWYGMDEAKGWRDLVDAVKATAKPAAAAPAKKAPAPAARPASAASSGAAAAPAKKGGAGGLIAALVVLALIGGGAYAYFSGLLG